MTLPDRPRIVACPHCGNEDRTLISKWIEPRNQIADAPPQDQKWYCELCGRTWIVQALPFGQSGVGE